MRAAAPAALDAAGGGRRSAVPVAIYNPLPAALAHYEEALAEVLRAAGAAEPERSVAPSMELGSQGLGRKVGGAARAVAAHRRIMLGDERLVIACWPTFGFLEPLLWRHRRGATRVTVVVHDPEPLRHQYGMGPLCARLGSRPVRSGGIEIVVHSRGASDALIAMGWPRPRIIPIPIDSRRCRSATPGAERPTTVSVCGQWKPVRDLAILSDLGPAISSRGLSPVVVGRGWPPVAGWEVRDTFLSEAALDDQIRRSACLLIPYTRFFQSDIAVRAVELGTPVVGPRQPFLEDLLGPSWPGLVGSSEPREWLRAIGEVTRAPASATAAVRGTYLSRCTTAWNRFLTDVPG